MSCCRLGGVLYVEVSVGRSPSVRICCVMGCTISYSCLLFLCSWLEKILFVQVSSSPNLSSDFDLSLFSSSCSFACILKVSYLLLVLLFRGVSVSRGTRCATIFTARGWNHFSSNTRESQIVKKQKIIFKNAIRSYWFLIEAYVITQFRYEWMYGHLDMNECMAKVLVLLDVG